MSEILGKYNISIPNLELRSGIPRNHLYKYAKGERTPSAENIYKLMLAIPGVLNVKDFIHEKKLKEIEREIDKRSGFTLV